MLVLSRKKNESIVINNDITIVVVEIRGDKVRLGVEAPKEVPVHRREVYDAIKRNAAVQSGACSADAGSNTALLVVDACSVSPPAFFPTILLGFQRAEIRLARPRAALFHVPAMDRRLACSRRHGFCRANPT